MEGGHVNSFPPDEWRIAKQQLGYPLYIIPLIGVTHIFGGVGLLIPNVPRLTEWVYAGLVIDLLLARQGNFCENVFASNNYLGGNCSASRSVR